MSKPRFSLYAEVDTLAHANTIKNSIATQLVGKDIFEQHSFGIRQDDFNNSTKIILYAEWRFNSVVDRDALRDWAKDQIQTNPQVKVWVLAARLSWHTCTHNDLSIENCKKSNYSEWNK